MSEPWVWWMHWTITHVKPVYYLKLFWSMWWPEISFSRILCMGPVLYPKEIYGIVLYQILSMWYYITFKKKTLTCGSQVSHMWVKSGLLCGSVGQVGQQVWPTFNQDKRYPIAFWALLLLHSWRQNNYKLASYWTLIMITIIM